DGSGAHGARDAPRVRVGPARVPRGTDSEEGVRDRVEPGRGAAAVALTAPVLSVPVAIGVGAIATALTLLPLRGLPRDGEVAQGARPTGEAAWHGVVGVLSLGTLSLGMQSRALLCG